MTDLAKLVVRLEAENSKLHAALEGSERKLKRYQGQTKRQLALVDAAFVKSAGVITAALGGIAFGAVASKALGTVASFESLHASLVTVTGSADAADTAFRNIQDFAKETPFQLEEVTNAYIKLVSLGLDPSMEAMRAYGDTAAAMGKDINQFIEAVADAATGEFERLRDFGIKASTEGDKVTFLFRGIRTTVKNSAEDIETYLQNIGKTEFAGGMERQMDTINGKTSNLADAMSRLAVNISNASGAGSAYKSILDSLITSTENWNKVLNPDKMIVLNDEMSDLIDRRKALNEIINDGPSLFGNTFIDVNNAKKELKEVDTQIQQINEKLIKLDRARHGQVDPSKPESSGGSGETDKAAEAMKKYTEQVTAADFAAGLFYDKQTALDQLFIEGKISADTYNKAIANLNAEFGDNSVTTILQDYENQLMQTQDELDAFLDKQALLDEMFQDGRIGSELYNDELDRMAASFGDVAKQGEDTASDLDRAFAGWANGLSSQLNDVLWDSERTFDDIARAFGKMITQILIQKAVVEPFMSSMGLTVTASAKGNAFTGGEITAFAQGGTFTNSIVDKPTLFPMASGAGLMGEAGPEAVMPLTRLPGGDLGVQASGSGTTVQIIDQRSGGAQADVSRSQGQNGEEIIRVLIRDEVKGALRDGSMDRIMRDTYGVRRQGIA